MESSSKVSLSILSIVSLLNVIFLPVYEIWGGLFPEDRYFKFTEVIELAQDGAWEYWAVQFTMSIFITSIFLLIAASIGNKGIFIGVNVISIIFVVKPIIQYADQNSMESVFDFERGCIAIGTWISLILYIIMFFTAIGARGKATNVNSHPSATPYPQPSTPICPQPPENVYSQPPSQNIAVKNETQSFPVRSFCPNCGANTKPSASFCGKCGRKL